MSRPHRRSRLFVRCALAAGMGLLAGVDGLAQTPATAETRVADAEAAIRDGDLARAAAGLLDVVDLEPPSAPRARAQLLLADLLLASGDWGAAADLVSAVLRESESFPPDASASIAALARRSRAIRRFRLRPAGEGPYASARPVAGLAVRRPVAVAAREDGALVVVDAGPDAALVWVDGAVVATRPVRRAGRPFWGADGVARVPAGATVVRLDTGEPSSPLPASKVRRIAAGAGSPAGTYLVVDRPLRVSLFGEGLSSESEVVRPPAGDPEDLDQLTGLGVHVLDRKGGRVLRFAGPGSGSEIVVAGLDRPKALAVGPLGDLFVLERGGRIRLVAPDGTTTTVLGPVLPGGLKLSDPEDLAVDGAGRLYVADPKLSAVVVVE